MNPNDIFTPDHVTDREVRILAAEAIADPRAVISSGVSEEARRKGERFANEVGARFLADFEKKGVDKMVHVSTFVQLDGMIYMTYYANCRAAAEDPNDQVARLAWCPVDDTENLTVLDIQAVGDDCAGRRVNKVYDTVLAQVDDRTLIVLWTAMVGENYYRLYRFFNIPSKTVGDVGVNRLTVGDVTNDLSTSGITSAFAANGIGIKRMFADIGIMQKFTSRTENGVTYHYTGAYSGNFNFLIKSRDFVTWEYVSSPDFPNRSKWENATYLLDGKIYYFVRRDDESSCGFLTRYDLETGTWEKPVLVEDCQSRSDFILYRDELYLFHAPIDREHIGILRIDRKDLANSRVLLQADMHGSCFYPFVQYFDGGELAISYTVSREHIRLARFDLKNYL